MRYSNFVGNSVEVVFSPSVSGEFIDSLMILSNDPREPRLVVGLVILVIH